MVRHAYNPSDRESEAEEWSGPGQPGLPGESKSQKPQNKARKTKGQDSLPLLLACSATRVTGFHKPEY